MKHIKERKILRDAVLVGGIAGLVLNGIDQWENLSNKGQDKFDFRMEINPLTFNDNNEPKIIIRDCISAIYKIPITKVMLSRALSSLNIVATLPTLIN